MCLSCAGMHRGLGVYISFVRSVSMDAFKVGEIARMDKGGNKAWRTFFGNHETTKMTGLGWDECTIGDRYGGEVGEEYKQRLTATVEGRDYVPEEKPKKEPATSQDGAGRARLSGDDKSESRSGTPSSRIQAAESSGAARKANNDAYFARLGAQNASRSDAVPPNQGGKFTGFGSDPLEEKREAPAMPGVEDFQKDPVAALTKGFGWFSTAVGKSAKSVNDGWIQPATQKVCIHLFDLFTLTP